MKKDLHIAVETFWAMMALFFFNSECLLEKVEVFNQYWIIAW